MTTKADTIRGMHGIPAPVRLAPVRLAIERHRVEDPGERQHTASAECWCEPVVEVVHRRLGIDAAAMSTEQQEAWIDQARKDGVL